jgi:hypothetical protein
LLADKNIDGDVCMFLQRLLQFVGWPITAGVIIALLALLLFPQLRAPNAQPRPTTATLAQVLSLMLTLLIAPRLP